MFRALRSPEEPHGELDPTVVSYRIPLRLPDGGTLHESGEVDTVTPKAIAMDEDLPHASAVRANDAVGRDNPGSPFSPLPVDVAGSVP